MKTVLIILIGTGFLILLSTWLGYYNQDKKIVITKENAEELKNKMKEFANNSLEITPEELFVLRKGTLKNKNIGKLYNDFEGVYVILNNTGNKYYVGKSKKVIRRLIQHFRDRGNVEIYIDFIYNNNFTIKAISLTNSGYSSIDKLEEDTKAQYKDFGKEYDKKKDMNFFSL
jgi:type II secretory pathway pseudopilin PulG